MPPNAKPVQRLHIVTVGTSLLLSVGWRRGQRLPAKRTLCDLLTTDARKHSAELNALIPFIDRGECTHVHLLATDTPECRLCRDAIAQYLHGRNIPTNRADAAGLLRATISRAVDQDSFYQAVRLFRDAVFRVAKKSRHRGNTVLVNATGGLKAETAVAALVAAQLGLSAYYIHESMTEPVFLPTTPLDPDTLKTLHRLNTPGKCLQVPPDDTDISRLEREGLVKISRRADGVSSSIRLTTYAKSLLKQSLD